MPDSPSRFTPPPIRRALWRAALWLMVGIGVFALASNLMGVKGRALATALESASPQAIVLASGSIFVLLAMHALRWNAVMRSVVSLTYGEAYTATLATYAVNAVIPARGADVLRARYIASRTGRPWATLIGAEILDHWVDLCGPIPSVVLLCVVGWVPRWVLRAAGVLGAFIVALGVFMIATRWHRPSQDSWRARVFSSLRDAYVNVGARRLAFVALFYGAIPWIGEACVIFVVARAFGITLTPPEAYSVLIGYKMGMALPSPAGIGGVEAGAAGALTLFGVAPATALAFGITYHAAQLVTAGSVGAAIIAWRGRDLIPLRDMPAPATIAGSTT